MYDEIPDLKPEHVPAYARSYVDKGPLSVKEYADWLKALREEKGLTLASLSELTGYSTSHLSQVETGKKKNMPTPEFLEKLAAPFGVRYSDLLSLAGYTDLAEGVKLREAEEIFTYSGELTEQGKLIERMDIKNALTQIEIILYNGHELSREDRQRILDVLKALFPDYQKPPATDEE